MRYLFWVIAAGVVIADQWTKYLVTQWLIPEAAVPVIPGLLFFTRLQNPGVAFGQFANGGPFLIAVAVAAALAIVLYRARLMGRGERLHPLLSMGLALPLGGALGNVIDRMRFGKVVDFIQIGWWPVFNVADSAITIGAVALVAYFLLLSQPEPAGGPAAAPRECGSEP